MQNTIALLSHSDRSLVNRRKHKFFLSLYCFFISIVIIAQVSFLPSEYQLLSVFFTLHIGLYAFPVFRSRPFDWFEPPVLAAVFGLLSQYRVIYLISYRNFDSDFLNVPLDKSIYLGIQVLSLLMCAQLCYFVGYYTHYGEKWGARIPVPIKNWSWKRMRMILIVGTMVALGCVLIITWKAGGPVSYFRNLGYWKVQTRLDGMETFRRGIYVIPYLGMLWFTYYVTQGQQNITLRKRIMFWLCLPLMLLASMWGGSRSFVIIPCIGMLMVSHYLIKRLSIAKIIVLSAGIVLFANIFLQYRMLTGQFSGKTTDSNLGIELINNRSYNPIDVVNEAVADRRGFDQLMYRINSTRIPEDLKWGQTYLYLLLTPIPRSAWAGKKQFANEVSAEVVPFVPSGFLGELYANFFIPGIMIGFFLWGSIQRATYAWLKQNPSNKSVVFMYVMFTLLVQEPTLIGLANGIPVIVLFIIFIRFIAVRKRHGTGPFMRPRCDHRLSSSEDPVTR